MLLMVYKLTTRVTTALTTNIIVKAIKSLPKHREYFLVRKDLAKTKPNPTIILNS